MSPAAANTASSINPKTWMHDMPAIGGRALKDIVIPGSHDSGTYELQHTIDNNSSQCQEISILKQLEAGSRYLDLRAWQASDGAYWMYHGTVWSNVKLQTALDDINTFLTQQPGEVVIATLLIDEKTGIDAGWQSACQQVSAHLATPADVHGKSFADVTPNELRQANKRLVMLRSGDVSQIACMDREGVYGDSLYPENYLKALEAYKIWSDKMWILHLGIPYKGDIGNTMVDRAGWNAKEFMPRFKGEAPHQDWLQRRLNIINVDFIQRFGWVDAIVNLNNYPKTWPVAITPQVAAQSHTWTLRAFNHQGTLNIQASTTAPFRAQQGQIYVYAAGHTVPADPDNQAAAWAWDNDAHSWDTGLKWAKGMHVVWIAEKTANGPHTIFLTLPTSNAEDKATATFTWKLRLGQDSNNKLILEGDTNAPFRAQQGQLHVYPQNMAFFPSDPDGKAEKWKYDDQAHPWQTDVPWRQGRHVAWVAHKPANGPYALFVKHVI